MREYGRTPFRTCLLLALTTVFAACGGGGDGSGSDASPPVGSSPPPQPAPTLPPPQSDSDTDDSVITATLSGSVGDGPVVGAALEFYDSDGADIASFSSGSNADYRLSLRLQPEQFPLTIEAYGGIDLVSNVEPEFRLISVVIEPGKRLTANLNPFSTLIVQTARAMRGGPTLNNIASARTSVLNHFGFGLDRRVVPDPMQTVIDETNVAVMVKTSEAAGEAIRRTRDVLLGTGVLSAEEVVEALAADLIDGVVDGRGASGVDARISAVATLVSAQVLVESLTNELKVNGVDASAAMDNAIALIRPGVATDRRTASVPTTRQATRQAALALAAAASATGESALEAASAVLDGLPEDILPANARGLLPPGLEIALRRAIERAAYGSEADVDRVNRRVRAGLAPSDRPVPGPAATYTVSRPKVTVDEGESVSFQVRRDRDTGEEYIVFRSKDLSATGYDDYEYIPSQTIRFEPGEMEREVVLETIGDGVSESEETFRVLLVEALNGGRIGNPFRIEVTIRDAGGGTPPVEPPVPAIDYVAPLLEGVKADGEFYALSWTHPREGLDGGFDIIVDGVSTGTRYRTSGLNTTVGPLDAAADHCFQVEARYVADGRSPRSNTVCVDGQSVEPPPQPEPPPSPEPPPPEPPPVENSPPSIGGRPGAVAEAGQPWQFRPDASDPDGDTLTFTIANRPDWANFDAATGRLGGTPSKDAVGRYEGIMITVSDGQAEASLGPFAIEVRAAPEQTGSITLSWDAPAKRVDGTSLDNLRGFRLYAGTSEDSMQLIQTFDGAGVLTHVVEGLSAGRWTFAITALDGLGQESRFSNVVVATID